MVLVYVHAVGLETVFHAGFGSRRNGHSKMLASSSKAVFSVLQRTNGKLNADIRCKVQRFTLTRVIQSTELIRRSFAGSAQFYKTYTQSRFWVEHNSYTFELTKIGKVFNLKSSSTRWRNSKYINCTARDVLCCWFALVTITSSGHLQYSRTTFDSNLIHLWFVATKQFFK